MGEEAFYGCPALKVSDLSRAIFEVHCLAFSVEGPYYKRHIDFEKLIELPSIVKQGFDVIADEAQKILKEENAEPKTTTDGGDKT